MKEKTWEEFVESLKEGFSPQIYDFFTGTKRVSSRIVIPAVASPMDIYFLTIEKNGEMIDVEFDNSPWNQMSIGPYDDMMKGKRFHEFFDIKKEEQKRFEEALIDFGAIEICKLEGNVVDHYTPRRNSMTEEQKKENDKWGAIFSSDPMVELLKKIMGE